jgi:hypothetical protein
MKFAPRHHAGRDWHRSSRWTAIVLQSALQAAAAYGANYLDSANFF